MNSESSKADDILKGDGKDKTEPIILIVHADPNDKDAVGIVSGLQEDMEDQKTVADVVTAAGVPEEYLTQQSELADIISDNGNSFLILVNIEQNGTDKKNTEDITTGIEMLNPYVEKFKDAGIKADLASASLVTAQITHQASEDLEKGEIIALPLALIVMVLVFGGFLAAGLPLIGAIVSIVGGMGALFGFSFVMDIDTTVLNVLTIIGLGLSIDYGLLMVSRFREVLRELPENAKSVRIAVMKTMQSAGRTVVFSGLTVAICTSALAFFEATIMKSVAVSAAAVIIIAILSSITLLPAIFTLLGYKLVKPSFLTKTKVVGRFLRAFGDVAPKEGVFSRLATHIQKAPGLVAVAGILLLTLLGGSILSLHVSSYGSPYLATSTGPTALFDDLADNYGAFKTSDFTLVIQGETDAQVEELAAIYSSALDKIAHVKNMSDLVISEDGYGVLTADSTNIREAQQTVAEIRDAVAVNGDEGNVLLTGNPAKDVDFNNALLEKAPIVVGLILLTTFILLFLMTGSIFIPIKAIILSALSLGASIGVITWGFEGGNLAGLLNFNAEDIIGISPIILVMIVVFGFGLAMDYEVFLISRIKEEYEKTGDNRLAIRNGLQGSGRIITSAGLIIVLVFLGFTLGDLLMIKQIGVALAVAILVDMTIVRCIIVPAVMTLFGRAVWWTPKPLRKFYDKFKIDH